MANGKVRRVNVGDLLVSAYVPPRCPSHKWELRPTPVTQCAYYVSLRDGTRQAFDDYVALAKQRHPDWGETYEDLLQLHANMEAEGWDDDRAILTVWQGSNLLDDGHHRAAVLLALNGPGFQVGVVDLKSPPPGVGGFECEHTDE